MDPIQLSNPPILEVVLDFGVEYPGGEDLGRLRAFIASLEAEYPDSQPIQQSGGDGEPEKEIGYFAYSPENTRAIQVSFRGLTVNELVPYTSWEDVSNQVRPLWDRFVEAFEISSVRWVGLRYINRLAHPTDETGTRQLLRSWPPFCEDLIERKPDGFLLRMEVPLTEPGVHAAISHALTYPDGENIELVIDNNVYVPAYEGDASSIWDTLDKLRDIKNKLFFGALTEEALGPYL